MIKLTPAAIAKVKDILKTTYPDSADMCLRVSIQGGGCSGFSYKMDFDRNINPIDKVYEFDGLKVLVDAASLTYLEVAEIDYIEKLEGAGFKFNNPNVKSTCGCGSSFSV